MEDTARELVEGSQWVTAAIVPVLLAVITGFYKLLEIYIDKKRTDEKIAKLSSENARLKAVEKKYNEMVLKMSVVSSLPENVRNEVLFKILSKNSNQ